MTERLQKVMANAGVASRRASEKMIIEGRVRVNGKTVTELGVKVSGEDAVEVDGHLLEQSDQKVYFILYKPRGVISAAKDDKNRKVVTDFFQDIPQRIYPVGRLDYDTSGLVLMTNDGDLANKLMHPRYHVNKTYVAKVKGIPESNELERLRHGVLLDKTHKSSPAKTKLMSVDKKKNTALVSLTIHEGRYHQVKRMLKSVGHPVEKLKRETYGFLNLDGLTSGDFRKLTNQEITALKKMVAKK
ncbi:pseudouridine synthase [Ligilactobacillus acidipiscis]|uniref:Pseudouridine synthase n=1 Tax=Ligilactobacillus acidipiscis TaxID=89059 RepID=A0A0R2KKB8_9LACO|nr:pseudouridine synthase [Ligilactobacillus acidipiscis]KRN86925.1 ribosomal large subunit pseudouridine synthase B [Ligilactobacillus acidipiscis]SFV40621.1 ribosomal large subunit pseudouridine synthase B [Ligilactobacillus acidipiscis]